MNDWIVKHRMPLFWAVAIGIHLAAFLFIRFTATAGQQNEDPEYSVLKLVDIEEYIPPPPPPEVPVTMIAKQPEASETIVETEQVVIENPDSDYVESPEPDYLPQHKISEIPEIPSRTILDRIEYPPMALRQGLEAVVFLELSIDQFGAIRHIKVLKDPGFGFAEAAVSALEGIRCTPARANGTPVAVRFRYPVRFSLN